MKFKHFLSQEKLRLIEVDKENDTELTCLGCLDLIYGPAYVDKDNDPDFFMHKSCAELPPQIQRDAFHPHPLRFITLDVIVCDGCGTLRPCLIGYRCMYCTFNLDFKCAVAFFNGELADHEFDVQKAKLIKTSIEHFSHSHQLTRCKYVPTGKAGTEILEELSWEPEEFKCMACKQDLYGTMIYTCLSCKFVLHESCVNEMPRQVLQSPFHPQHILRFQPVRSGASQTCEACMEDVYGISFYCTECNINLHVSCAKYRTRAIKHSCHPDHHLIHLGKSINIPYISCDICGQDFNDSSFFGCTKCLFYVHVECIPELSHAKQIRHHLHPLVLTTSFVEDNSGEYYCDMCETERNSEHHVYYCNVDECNYIAHVDCVLFEDDPTDEERFLDRQQMAENFDESKIADTMNDTMLEYNRDEQVPYERKIQKEAFHHHPLTLSTDPDDFFVCDGCGELSVGSSYRCIQCLFFLDMKCVALNDELAKHKAEEGRKIKPIIYHFSHSHPLNLCKRPKEFNEYSCMACKKSLCGQIIYICLVCKFFLHKSCLDDMLMEVQSPFHPQHLLLPYQLSSIEMDDNPRCIACEEEISCFAYVCFECKIGLHSSCAKYQTRDIKHSCHDHRLLHLGESIFVESSPRCHECGEKCRNTLFCCTDCRFHMHLECIPLPYSVKHKRHLHPLTLTNSVIEDDSGEYYCDICETERNPELDVYYCEECTFIAHIDCVISEVEPPEILEDLVPRRLSRRLTLMK